MKLCIKKAVALLSPLQQGVGVKGATENIIRYIRHLTQKLQSEDVCLQVDMNNAFNSMFRHRMLQEVASSLPELFRWAHFCYSQQSQLFCHSNIVHSSRGVQQGDPLGPLLFALTLHPVARAVESLSPTIRQRWYLDDGTIVAAPALMANIVPFLTEQLIPLGLILNPAKSVWWSHSILDLPPSISGIARQSVDDDVIVLGVPLGSSACVTRKLLKTMDTLRRFHDNLGQLQSPSCAYLLLRHCLSSQKVAFLLRNLPFNQVEDFINSVSVSVERTLCSIIGTTLSDGARSQIYLLHPKGAVALAGYMASSMNFILNHEELNFSYEQPLIWRPRLRTFKQNFSRMRRGLCF